MVGDQDRAARVFLQAAQGVAGDLDNAVASVYDELRRLARAEARRARDAVLQPTALVHETYLRLRAQRSGGWSDQASFLAVAARVMRRVLVDEARSASRLRRGGDRERESDHETRIAVHDEQFEVIEVSDVLDRLAASSERQARIAELFVFGGLSIDQVAAALELSPRTVDRHWRFARAWLVSELRTGARGSSNPLPEGAAE